jgi:hypothetical protein
MFLLGLCLQGAAADTNSMRVRVSLGQREAKRTMRFVRLVAGSPGVIVSAMRGVGLEAEDVVNERAWLHTGAGDVDAVECDVLAPAPTQPPRQVHEIWEYLLNHTTPGAAQRLREDPAMRPDSPLLTLELSEDGTRGFSIGLEQLRRQRAMWFPESDVFVTLADPPVDFARHLASLKGERVLDRVRREPEATYAQWTARWEDMGSPAYQNPKSVPPGHTVGLTWDSALYKFGVDRLAGVRNDDGKADVFHFHVVLTDAAKAWRGQKLADGLPLITSSFEEAGVRYEIEQFAAPLHGPPAERRGDLAMVLLHRITLCELEGKARPVPVMMRLTRELTNAVSLRQEADGFVLGDGANTWLAVQGTRLTVNADVQPGECATTVTLDLPPHGAGQFIVKLPSPVVPAGDRAPFLALDYAASRGATVKFWNDTLAQGAYVHVPEEAVNTLFRANLWHALRLPRRHGGPGPDVRIDLPYSNFAYDQTGTPWPVNQAVYVDYMLYDLRGHHALAAEELAVQYRNNQESSGHVGGFANWGVYTPGMLYSVAQHYLLSGDRASFERLLPQTLRALDWCLGEMKRAADSPSSAPGLVLAPLNDLSHDARAWAFNQAYFVAGVDLLGRALAAIRHPRAAECRTAAQTLRAAVERQFARASVRSPAVQLGDGTWIPYVPSDAQGSGRRFEAWYPSDVDSGPLHLARLQALDPRGPLSTAMLHDHEDNLFLQQWGTINEPVYNMQGTAYLLRDEPKAAIRTFYSTMACAFSHSVFEPVEHRWGWGQYFGPPSTDGAWFELYRNLLIREQDDDTLLLCQATPRAWLAPGGRIEVRRAPTYYGPLSLTMESRADAGEITTTLDLPARKQPAALFVRFRHPREKPLRAATVNGRAWKDFDPAKEWVRIPQPKAGRWVITAKY